MSLRLSLHIWSERSPLDHFITTIAFVCLFWHGCGDAGMIGLHNIDAPIQLSPSSQQVERYYLSCPVWLIYLWLSLNIVEHLYIFEYFHIFEYLNIFVYLWIFLNIFTYNWISLNIFDYLWISLIIFEYLCTSLWYVEN